MHIASSGRRVIHIRLAVRQLHSKRERRWVHSLGKADLNATFSPPKMLEVSTQQAAILLLFNDVEELTVEDIQKSTNISMEDVKKNLFSLLGDVKPAKKILLKTPPGSKVIEADHVVRVNTKFTDK